RRVPMCDLNLTIERLVALCLVNHGVDLRERDVVLGCPAQRFLALRADQEWRMWALHQRRRQGRVLPDGPVFAVMNEILVGPDATDDVEGFQEHLARVLLV